ncbi:MAG: sigma-70 family RNA polymerase sigma factor [Oscillospiraceae bacterium]|nr:sigma-70 family RNA polymerase sigma factor [Oscillospiraceae bacterium]
MVESEIIKLLKAHNEAGLTALQEHYGPFIDYILRPILPETADREECLGEVNLKIWDSAPSYDAEKGSFKAWLGAIARNCALNHRRKARPAEELSEDLPSQDPTPEEQTITKERLGELHEALRRLTDSDREIIYRKYFYMQSEKQIAAEKGTTVRAIEGRLYRIKKRLREALGGESHE